MMGEAGAKRARRVPSSTLMMAVITTVITGWALKETYLVTMPLALAFFLAVLVWPVQRWLHDHLPRHLAWLSVFAALLSLVLVVSMLSAALWVSVRALVDNFPNYQTSASVTWKHFLDWAQVHHLPIGDLMQSATAVSAPVLSLLTAGISSIWTVLAMILLAFLLLALMLIEAREWEDKTRRALSPHRAALTIETLAAISVKVRWFVIARTAVSLMTGVSTGLWLWIAGVQFPLLWGSLAFVLNYIPFIGSAIAVIPPTLLAFLVQGPWTGTLVIAGLLVIQQFFGNFVDPRLQGRTLEISPMVVLLSVLFWGWIWGAAGAILGVVLTETIIIACDHIPSLQPIAVLLSRGNSAGDGAAAKD